MFVVVVVSVSLLTRIKHFVVVKHSESKKELKF